MAIYLKDGLPLLGPDGKVATDAACCCGGICPITENCLDQGALVVTFSGITVGCGCEDFVGPFDVPYSIIATDISVNDGYQLITISGSAPYITSGGEGSHQYHLKLYFGAGCVEEDLGVESDKGAATFVICAEDNSGLYVFYKDTEALFFAKVTAFGVPTDNLLGSGDPDYPGCGGLFTVPAELRPLPFGDQPFPVVGQGGSVTVQCLCFAPTLCCIDDIKLGDQFTFYNTVGDGWIPNICVPGFTDSGFGYYEAEGFSTTETDCADVPNANPIDVAARLYPTTGDNWRLASVGSTFGLYFWADISAAQFAAMNSGSVLISNGISACEDASPEDSYDTAIWGGSLTVAGFTGTLNVHIT